MSEFNNPYTELDNKLYDRVVLTTMYWQTFDDETEWYVSQWFFDLFEKKFISANADNVYPHLTSPKVIHENDVPIEVRSVAKPRDVLDEAKHVFNKVLQMNQGVRIDRKLYLDEVLGFYFRG